MQQKRKGYVPAVENAKAAAAPATIHRAFNKKICIFFLVRCRAGWTQALGQSPLQLVHALARYR
jgi:hypothetical protein